MTAAQDRILPCRATAAPDMCPRCGSDDLQPRVFPRGIEVFCCSSCGEQLGPALLPVLDAASARVVIPLHRRAAKLSMSAGPCVSLFAPAVRCLP